MTLHPRADPSDQPPSGLQPAREETAKVSRTIPEATVARLAVYLRVLGEMAAAGSETVSSEDLAAAAGVNSAKLRKDLSFIGSNGTRGVGYEVARLVQQIERTLGLTRRHAVALVGVGNLGHALAGYSGFASRGFPLRALFDVDPDLVGIHIAGILVEHADRIPEVCVQRGVTIGVIATPASAAQVVCDQLVQAGVRSILNFAPVVLQVPEEVEVRKVDLAVEMQILSFHVARRHGEPTTADSVPEKATEKAGTEKAGTEKVSGKKAPERATEKATGSAAERATRDAAASSPPDAATDRESSAAQRCQFGGDAAMTQWPDKPKTRTFPAASERGEVEQ